MKQKKSPKVIDIPSNNEIKASVFCQQLEFNFDNFQKNKSDEQFQQFLRVFFNFLNGETNNKLLFHFSSIMIQNAIEHITSIDFNSVFVNQAFALINTIIIKMGAIFSASSFTTFFLFLANGDDGRLKILTEKKKIISNIFSADSMFHHFINSKNFFK